MERLSREQVIEILKKQDGMTEEIMKISADVFDRVILEESNRNKTLKQQDSLVTFISEGIANGETYEFAVREKSDNKHMNYFDVFLRQGESDKVEEALIKHNLPTNALRGLKPNSPANQTVDGVKIVQVVSEDELGSITIESLTIEYNGEVIYSYKRESTFGDVLGDYQVFREAKKYSKRKDGSQRQSKYIGTILRDDGERIIRSQTKSGRIINQDSKGRFTSV